jgi:hypothetical protein
VSDLVLPPGIQVLEITPRRPLQLPKFLYRSLNFEATPKKFGDLEVGASFFYNNVIALYKVSSDTALSTTTGISYTFNPETPITEMLFPEVGELVGVNKDVVETGVVSGSTSAASVPFFVYYNEENRNHYNALFYNNKCWRDQRGNTVNTIFAVRKTFVL